MSKQFLYLLRGPQRLGAWNFMRGASAIGVALLVSLASATHAVGASYVYVSNADDGDISIFQLDEETGALSGKGRAKAAELVMPMAVSPDKRHLFAAVRAKPFRVFAYGIDRSSGRLTETAVSELPDNMPFISVDRSGRYLFGASFSGDLVSVSRISADGKVQAPAIQVVASGRNTHSIKVDRTNRFAYVPNLGTDQVLQWKFDDRTGTLTYNTPGLVQMRSGIGPRHFEVAPDNRFVFVLNELIATVSSFSLNPATGLLTPVSESSALPAASGLRPGVPRAALGGISGSFPAAMPPPAPRDLSQDIWAADIHLTPNGRFLYVTERTGSTISTFMVDTGTGRLTFVSNQPTEKQPRGFAIDERGKFLVVAGEKAETVSVYSIDPQNGSLTRQGQYPSGKGANWVEIVQLP